MLRHVLLTMLLMATLGVTGCTSGPPSRFAESAAITSSVGHYEVRYLLPDPLPLNEPFSIDAWVQPSEDGVAMEGTEFVVDAAMPHHHHGMNQQPQITQRTDGSYAIDGMLFHMPGYWEIYFDVTRGAVTERAQVSVELE